MINHDSVIQQYVYLKRPVKRNIVIIQQSTDITPNVSIAKLLELLYWKQILCSLLYKTK